MGGCVALLETGLRHEASSLLPPQCAPRSMSWTHTPANAVTGPTTHLTKQSPLPWRVHALTTPQFATPLKEPKRISPSSPPKRAPLKIQVHVITSPSYSSACQGTNTSVICQAVRGNSDLPARAWGAASVVPPAPLSAPWMLQRGHSWSRPVQSLPPKSAVEITTQSIPGVTTSKSASDEIGKITIDVKQTSR